MSSYHFSMGAINKSTNNYEYPKIANKKNKYNCPSCENGVIFRHGKINRAHFAHRKSDTPCYYYDKPSESQIHKDAKMLMKTLLDNKNYIFVGRNCNYCCYEQTEGFVITEDEYNENVKAVIEYKFIHNNSNKSADVALIENDKIKCIFEICYKNKTNEENRPEPWVEIDALDLINKINSGEIMDDEGNISIECIRNHNCDRCIENEELEKQLYHDRMVQMKIDEERKEQERKLYYEKMERINMYNYNERKEEERRGRESIQNKEEDILRKEKEKQLRQPCKCGIMFMNICLCEQPKYEFMKLSNNFYCVNCNKWKDRCN